MYFAGDHHFFHAQIIEYCNRPFKSEREMRRKMIDNHNEVVGKGDTVWFLGDLALVGTSQWEKIKGLLNKLNGRKHLILGNHDELKPFRYVDCGFISVHTAMSMTIEGVKFVLAHDSSVYCTIKDEAILLCGHSHTLFKSLKNEKVVNVGVDQWDFKPIDIDTIKNELK